MCPFYHSLAYLINTRSNMVSLGVCLNLCLSLEAGFHCSAACNPDVNWNFLFSWVLGETWINSQFLVLWVSQVFPTMSLNSQWILWIPFPLEFFSSYSLFSVPQWPDMKLRSFSDSHALCIPHTNYLQARKFVQRSQKGRNGRRACDFGGANLKRNCRCCHS